MTFPSDQVRSKICFIFNPFSGHNERNPYLLQRTRDFVEQHRWNARIEVTERPRHATELARQAIQDGCTLVVAIGGDGTLNETATALINTDVALGLIPCGSGNGLGRHLGIPNPGTGAYRTLLEGRIRTIDTGNANGFPFFNAMGVGFDAEISTRFNQLARRGFSAYVRTGLATLLKYQPDHYSIVSGADRISSSAFVVAVANSDQYGNNFFIAPGAQVDDGALNLTLVKRVTPLSVWPLALRMFRGTIGGSSQVIRSAGASFSITRSAAGPIHTDGEVHDTGAAVEVRVAPRSLKVLVPAGT